MIVNRMFRSGNVAAHVSLSKFGLDLDWMFDLLIYCTVQYRWDMAQARRPKEDVCPDPSYDTVN